MHADRAPLAGLDTRGRVKDGVGPTASRNAAPTVTLLDAMKELRLDYAIGGARRDEEKARAKGRVFSHRDYLGGWDRKNERVPPTRSRCTSSKRAGCWLRGSLYIDQSHRVFPSGRRQAPRGGGHQGTPGW